MWQLDVIPGFAVGFMVFSGDDMEMSKVKWSVHIELGVFCLMYTSMK